MDEFGFDFHKIPLFGIVEARGNIVDTMVTCKLALLKELLLLTFADKLTNFTKINNVVGLGKDGAVCTKSEPARSNSNEILEIDVPQEFGLHALYQRLPTINSDIHCQTIYP